MNALPSPSPFRHLSGPDVDGTIAPFRRGAAQPRPSHGAPSGVSAESQIFRETGAGRIPTIVVGGFLPDATESVVLQRDLLVRHGDVYYLNYPRGRFSTETLFDQITGLIRHLNARGEHPVLFSICFGSGLVVKFLREAAHPALGLNVAGLVMVSPVLCAADMAPPNVGQLQGGTKRERAERMFFLSDTHDDIEQQVTHVRRAFARLFRRERLIRFWNDRDDVVVSNVMAAVNEITATGYYERALALKALTWPASTDPIFSGAALVLYAEDEGRIFVPSSPTLAALRRSSVAAQLFPQASIREVASADADDPVTHGSIVVHHRYFNPFIADWYDGLSGSTPA